MSDPTRPGRRSVLPLFLSVLMAAPALLPACAGEPGAAEGPALARVTDNSSDLIIGLGETYTLGGTHAYTRSVQVNGTLRVTPYDGVNESTGTLALSAPWIYIGPAGRITGDGRGFGGGGGGQNSDDNVAGGSGGSGGRGGAGRDSYYSVTGWQNPDAGGGGGGSNGGAGGRPGGVAGTENGGGTGGSGLGGNGGNGGTGFGGGGGGGAGGIGGGSGYGGAGGGGGGGSGGKTADWYNGGDGAGPFGGAGGAGITSGAGGAQGSDGGYLVKKGNGDTSTDLSVVMGGGGGGGGATSDVVYGGAPGGGGAGGACVSLTSSGDLKILGSITTTGAGGGTGGMGRKASQGSAGGGGAGGGIALRGEAVTLGADLDARGRNQDTLTTGNGGTVKIVYTERTGAGVVSAGRVFKNGRPVIPGLLLPENNSFINSDPQFNWTFAADPDGDAPLHHLMVDDDPAFSSPELDRTGLPGAALEPSGTLPDGTYYWRVRAGDAWGFGRWSETWKFTIDRADPSSSVGPLPAYTTTFDIDLSWNSSDDASGVSNCTLYVSENGGDFRPFLNRTALSSAAFTGAEGRNYRFYSVARDRARNEEKAPDGPDASTTVDTLAPVSTMSRLPAYTNSSSFPVSWSGKDETSGLASYTVYVSDNEGEFSPWQDAVEAKGAVFSGVDGHSYRFYVRARDIAGNFEGEPGPGSIVATAVDLTAPGIRMNIGDPQDGRDPVFIAPSTPITAASEDSFSGLSGILYSVDGGGAQSYSGPITGLSPGFHNLSIWSEDNAGNRGKTLALWLFVDGQAPRTVFSLEGNNTTRAGVRYVTPQARVVLECRDNGSGVLSVEYALDGDYQAYTGPFPVGGSGARTLRFRGTDRLGNREAEQSAPLFVDGLPPSTTATVTVDREAMAASVAFMAADAASGVAATRYRVFRNGALFQDWTTGASWQLAMAQDQSTDGNYTVEYGSSDNLGNAEAPRTVKLSIDTVAALEMASGDRSTSTDTFIVSGRAEQGSTVSVNGRPVPTSSNGSFSTEVALKEGKNLITVTVRDRAGNEQTRDFTVTYNKPAAAAGGGLLLPILAAVAVAAILVAAVLLVRRRGRPVEKPIGTGKAAGAPPAPEAAPKEPPGGGTP
jgi:hypothetical protein